MSFLAKEDGGIIFEQAEILWEVKSSTPAEILQLLIKRQCYQLQFSINIESGYCMQCTQFRSVSSKDHIQKLESKMKS